jgi:hypothetical protein
MVGGLGQPLGGEVSSIVELGGVDREPMAEDMKRRRGVLGEAMRRGANMWVITCVEVTFRDKVLSKAARMLVGLASLNARLSKVPPRFKRLVRLLCFGWR